MDRNLSHRRSFISGPSNCPQRRPDRVKRVSAPTVFDRTETDSPSSGVSSVANHQFEKWTDECKLPNITTPRHGIVALPLIPVQSDETTRKCQDNKQPMLAMTGPPKFLRRHGTLPNTTISLEAKLPMNSDPTAWSVAREDWISRNCASKTHLNLHTSRPKEVVCKRASLPNIPGFNAKIFGTFKGHHCQEYGEHASTAKWHTNAKALQKFIENADESYDRSKEKAILLHNWMLQQRPSSE